MASETTLQEILDYCSEARTVDDITSKFGYAYNTVSSYLSTLKQRGLIQVTLHPVHGQKRLYQALSELNTRTFHRLEEPEPRPIEDLDAEDFTVLLHQIASYGEYVLGTLINPDAQSRKKELDAILETWFSELRKSLTSMFNLAHSVTRDRNGYQPTSAQLDSYQKLLALKESL